MISDDDLQDMTARARALRDGFAGTAPRPWDAVTAAAELAVQLGHLAHCAARRHGLALAGLEDPARPITSDGDEIADVALAALSITILSGQQPGLATAPTARAADGGGPGALPGDVAQLLILAVAAGQLAEAAMTATGHRHQPAGNPPGIPAAAGTVLAEADRLARLHGTSLPAEFTAMAADATRFLASRRGQA